MMPTNSRLDGLRQRLVALRTRFDEVGARAADAAPSLAASVVPGEALLDELRATSSDFHGLRHAIVDEFADVPNTPDPATLGTLKALDVVLAAMEHLQAEQARRAAWETARDQAVAVLERVMGLGHREDRESTALAECHAQARELHGALLEAPSGDATQLAAHLRPFVEVITLAEGWNRLDDDQCVALQDTIAANFGRPLGRAALRGMLAQADEIVWTPEPEPATSEAEAVDVQAAPEDDVQAAPEAEPLAEPITAEPGALVEPVTAKAEAPTEAEPMPSEAEAVTEPEPVEPEPVPKPRAPERPAREPAAPVRKRARSTAPPAANAERPAAATPVDDPAREAPAHGGRRAPPGSTLVTQIRLSGQHIEIETPEQEREREELLERLADDTARWWLGARAGWESLVQRGLRPADAARDTLKRFPYLLAVPLSRCDEFDDGRLAEGYGILLQRLEKEEPGFVHEALTRLKPQLTGRAQDESYPLGEELYQYVVAEGRLYKTFPEFVSEVLVHVLPEPGLWVQGAITETEDATTVVTRAEQPGNDDARSRTLTTSSERFTTHAFNVTTGPLTARVFSIQTGELPVPIDLEIRLLEDGAPRDHAWIIVAPLGGKPEPPRKHRAGGTKIDQFGQQHGAVWVAVFNSDPNADKSYQLTVALHRKPPKVQPTFSKVSPFKKSR